MANDISLIKSDIGIFKGFTESGREFIAEVVTPYHPEFIPLLGSFILVTVTERQALLGRINQFYPMGTMAGTEADEYLSHLQKLNRPVPEDVKELKLRYNVKVRLLGTVELNNTKFKYRPGVRSLPHLGAKVCIPTNEALQYLCNASLDIELEDESKAVKIGHYALGDKEFTDLEVNFSFKRLLSKRTFIFARAGYGKSNLVKLLVSKLYEQESNVGMLIFDPEGEYSFQDAQGRPGLADIPDVRKRLVIFTDRRPPKEEYKSLIAGSVKLNLSNIHASHVIDICLPESRKEQVYINRLMGFNQQEWSDCVAILHQHGYRLNDEQIKENKDHFNIDFSAVIRNFTPIIHRLHDPNSQLPQSVLYNLSQGHIVVVDISLLSSGTSQQVAGLILKTVFDHNVSHFTSDDQKSVIPVIAVIEEAQNVLSAEKMREDSPFVEWAKEGRKYKLGCILVTQQPGAISDQLLSQGDNFFALHLISSVDLDALKRNNAHFSDDILSYILNEPIEGNVYYWSSPSQPYVISAKLLNFEEYINDRIENSNFTEPEQKDQTAQDYKSFSEKIHKEIRELIEDGIFSERTVPVYTPEKDGIVISNYGVVGQMNLRFQVAEKFIEKHKDINTSIFSEFFEFLDKGNPRLRQSLVSNLGKTVRGSKEGKESDYILIPLGNIDFQNGKKLDGRRVTIIES